MIKMKIILLYYGKILIPKFFFENMKYTYGMLLIALAGLGITAYWATASGTVSVYDEEIKISPGSYTVEMNQSSIFTKNLTVSTTRDEETDVIIKVLPADYETSSEWGNDFIAFASPSEVTINSSNNAKVTIVHYSEDKGNYKVKTIASR